MLRRRDLSPERVLYGLSHALAVKVKGNPPAEVGIIVKKEDVPLVLVFGVPQDIFEQVSRVIPLDVPESFAVPLDTEVDLACLVGLVRLGAGAASDPGPSPLVVTGGFDQVLVVLGVLKR